MISKTEIWFRPILGVATWGSKPPLSCLKLRNLISVVEGVRTKILNILRGEKNSQLE
jgi:hypothetical protein